jgi:Kef-type K+ transport system membrane component KefB
MNIDFRELARDPVWLLGSAIALVAVKSIILIALARLFRLSWRASIETGLLLGPGGEFAFVGISMATTLGLIDAKVSGFTVALTSLTMVLIPALSHVRGGSRQWCAKTSRSIPNLPSHRAAAPTMPLSSDMAGSDKSSAPCSIGTNSSTLPSTMTLRPCRSSAGRDAPSIMVMRPIRNF